MRTMAGKQQDENARINFETAGLFRADGFESGNLLQKYFPHLSASDLRDVLADVVLRDVVPLLDQQVSVTVIPSARNPVRVTRVGTDSVVWHTADAGTGPAITPAVVAIDVEKARSRIPKHAAKAPEPEAEPEPGDLEEL